MKRKTMPWKNPDNWQWLFKVEFLSPVLAAVIALLRAAYDDKEPSWMRRLLESCLCGFLAIGASALVAELGFDSANARVVAGSLVGLYGIDYVRAVGRRIANRRLGQ